MSPSSFFKVELKQMDTISAALPLSMPQEHLSFSNLDLLIPQFHVSTFFCYKNDIITTQNYTSFGSKVTVLKKSLAQALVLYYPFAGEITLNLVGEPQLVCNNRGVDFFQVHADVDLVDLNMHNPDESIGDIMVPTMKNGTLAVQVTKLRCGSIIVGCTFDHRVADAHSMNMFLVSWAEMAQSKPISLKPNFQRSLLNPRIPINSAGHASIDNLYATISSLPPPPQNPPPIPSNHRILRRIYVIPAAELHRLQTLASSESGAKCSKLASFTSYLWKLIAKCDSENGKDELTTRLGIVVNGRSRLVNDKPTDGQGTNRSRQMMEAYFGNVLSIPYGEELVGKLNQTDLNQTASNVVQLLKAGTSMEHFMNLIDWVEVHRPEPTLAKVYCSGTGDESALVISCGRGFPSREVDFGWGRPWIGSYHFPIGGTAAYVMPMPSPARNGDWIAYMYLRVEQFEVVDKFAGNVLKPVTNEYLDSIM